MLIKLVIRLSDVNVAVDIQLTKLLIVLPGNKIKNMVKKISNVTVFKRKQHAGCIEKA